MLRVTWHRCRTGACVGPAGCSRHAPLPWQAEQQLPWLMTLPRRGVVTPASCRSWQVKKRSPSSLAHIPSRTFCCLGRRAPPSEPRYPTAGDTLLYSSLPHPLRFVFCPAAPHGRSWITLQQCRETRNQSLVFLISVSLMGLAPIDNGVNDQCGVEEHHGCWPQRLWPSSVLTRQAILRR
jgi:hypothetical protein